MTTILFKKFLSILKRLIPSGISLTNCHPLILDGHGSHVILQTIKQAHQFGSNMVILPSYISHVLQPLDVSCFKSFKTTFEKEKDGAMVKNNYNAPNNLTLAS
jgi:hypothetical protein